MTYGVDKIMLLLPIQIHHVLPKSYLLGALVEIKSRAASFLTKNRNVDLGFFFLCIPNEGNVHETVAARSSSSRSSGYPVSIYKRSQPR